MSVTINEHIDSLLAKFSKLSASRRSQLKQKAIAFITSNPSCADHSGFWRGLSARQVVAAATHR